ncbi:MAG: amidohydrolase family protein [Paracoccaceae bacterium]
MSMTIFTNAMMLDARSDAPREGSLLVDGGRIKEISDGPITAEGARVIDLGGRTLMPGLIDAHVHVKATALDLSVLMRTPVSYLMGQTHAIMKAMLMRGFTTVRDAAGADRGLADAVDHGLYTGPRLRVCGLALSQTGGHSDTRPVTVMSYPSDIERHNHLQHLGRIADGVDECRRAARDELRKGAHHVKIMAGGGVSSPSDPIENTQYSMDELIAINEEAAAWQTYTMAHTYTPEAITMSVNAGVRTCEHCNLIDKPTAALMAQKGAYHVPTNITYHALNKHGAEWGFPQVSIDKLGMIVDVGLEAVEKSRDAGVKIGFGTDLLGPCHHYQADEFGLAAEVLGNKGALHASLEVNPEIMRMDDVGRLAPGYLADLIAVDGNPLEDITCLHDDGAKIPFVMKEGVVFKNLF